MTMQPFGSWNSSFMGQLFLDDTQQTGPRGADKLYSTNWLMGSVEHRMGSKGAVEVDAMLSLEPATITDRRYPLLFQTGETAFGNPIIDGQHPHNFVMALGLHYARSVGEYTVFDIYAAPVGDPALGPVAFPHRASALELPQATIAHHWEDSTHIADDVITVGVSSGKWKLEASGFHGAEPGENRWTIGYGAMDSWSGRLWFMPTERWAVQISTGRLAHPEALEPGDQVRATASVEYSRPMRGTAWSSSLIWGRDHSTASQHNLDAYTAETLVPLTRSDFVTGRAELVDKDELFASGALEGRVFRVGAYTVGYTHDVDLLRRLESGLGGNVEMYSLPDTLKPYYGQHPVSLNVYLRLRLR
jgi:hypothetical protein